MVHSFTPSFVTSTFPSEEKKQITSQTYHIVSPLHKALYEFSTILEKISCTYAISLSKTKSLNGDSRGFLRIIGGIQDQFLYICVWHTFLTVSNNGNVSAHQKQS